MGADGLNATGPIPDTPVSLHYRMINKDSSLHSQSSDQTLVFTLSLTRRSLREAHKVTHLHPSGMVSYAMLRPPSKNATCRKPTAPVMLQFHGAGVEAESPAVGHSLDSLPDLCAWILFPTGVTPWSADDWHNFGFADVEAAITAIPEWIKQTGWEGVGVDTEKWFISGHSNGGQGSWYALTHRPDKIFGASPVSGYLSIHSYVPYQFWRTMDPRRRAIIEASANSYRHELLAGNVKGIPIFQQHGEKDDNVPTYHSRLMNQLLFEAGTDAKYFEVPGQGHYWDGVMATDGLSGFYRQRLGNPKAESKELMEFEMVVANPGDTGSKGGVSVLHLVDPGVLGKVKVNIDEARGIAKFATANVLAIELSERFKIWERVMLDGQELSLGSDKITSFWMGEDGRWAAQVSTLLILWDLNRRTVMRVSRGLT
jgi:predicted esterase